MPLRVRGTTNWCPPILILVLCAVPCSGSSEPELLLKFKESLQNKNATVFSTWNTSTSPCSAERKRPNWAGVLCSVQGKIWGLKLENMGLKGVIDVDALQQLPNLRTLSFVNNDFDTTWPELNKLPPLKSFYLSNNKFSGEIPAQTFQGMHWLKKIHLSNNEFTGDIPTSLTFLPRLLELRLEGNKFSGRIPNFPHKNHFNSFSVANNQLHGKIPGTLSTMPTSSFAGNEGLCGTPLGACHSSKTPSIISTVVIAIVVGVALILIGAIIFILHRRKRPKKADDDEGQGNNSNHHDSNRSKRGENMKLCFVRKDREIFDLQDLLRASAEILGSGTLSSSYRAALLNGPIMVVKRFKQMNNVGREEFQEHMRRIGRLDHPNLLPLVAYYYRKEEKLLVTDYVRNGSLALHLHLQDQDLDWPTRLKIVKGITKGLEYLYKEMPSLIVPHGHLKSSNVLLTQSNFEPLLNDYSLVPVMNQELAQETLVMFRSPEYLQHGEITKKTDIWSLGILILEILSGKLGGEMDMVEWVNSVEWSREVFDKQMGGTRNTEGEMVKLLRIGLGCCEADVDKRWDLKEAVERILEVKERDHDDDFYSSYASEADMRSSRAMSDEINFSIN